MNNKFCIFCYNCSIFLVVSGLNPNPKPNANPKPSNLRVAVVKLIKEYQKVKISNANFKCVEIKRLARRGYRENGK